MNACSGVDGASFAIIYNLSLGTIDTPSVVNILCFGSFANDQLQATRTKQTPNIISSEPMQGLLKHSLNLPRERQPALRRSPTTLIVADWSSRDLCFFATTADM